MTSPPDPAEMWIEPGPPAPRRGRAQWIAIGAGAAILIAAIAAQRLAGGPEQAEPPPVTPTVTAPPSPPATPTTVAPDSSGPVSTIPPAVTTTESATIAQHTTTGSWTMASHSTTTDANPVPSEDWTLAGYQWDGTMGAGPSAVIRYTPKTGQLVTTSVPAPMSSGPLSFAATADAAVIRPIDAVPGFLVRQGQFFTFLTGQLARSSRVFPGPSATSVWAWGATRTLTLLDLAGAGGAEPDEAVASIPVPSALTSLDDYSITSDGAGAILASGVGGTYLVDEHGIDLVTRGAVIATGPSAFLTLDCDRNGRCAVNLLDRATGDRRPVPLDNLEPDSLRPSITPLRGLISPDGSTAALTQYGTSGVVVIVVNLATGTWQATTEKLSYSYGPDVSQLMSFTPDSRTLLMSTWTGIAAIDIATTATIGALPVPPLAAFQLLPAP